MATTSDGGIAGIKGEVAFGGIQRVLADVEIGHPLRPAAGGIKREAAGEAEGVENCPAARQRFDEAAVLALIEEESGLLPLPDIRLEADAIFAENHRSVILRPGV